MSDYFSDGYRCCWYEENKISFQSFTELILVLFMYFSINGIQNHITVIMWSCNFLIFKKNIILEKLRVNISCFFKSFFNFHHLFNFQGQGRSKDVVFENNGIYGLKNKFGFVFVWAYSLSLFLFMHWRRKWKPTPVFLPGESQGRRSLVGCRLWGHTESDTTEVT